MGILRTYLHKKEKVFNSLISRIICNLLLNCLKLILHYQFCVGINCYGNTNECEITLHATIFICKVGSVFPKNKILPLAIYLYYNRTYVHLKISITILTAFNHNLHM